MDEVEVRTIAGFGIGTELETYIIIYSNTEIS